MARAPSPSPARPPALPAPPAPEPERPDDLLSVRQVAKKLGVSVGRVHQLIQAGALRASRLAPKGQYRVMREWVWEFIRSREVRRGATARPAAGGAA